MGKEILMFGNIEIQKHKFYCKKNPIFKKDVDIEKLIVSENISSVENKYK